MFHIIRTKSHNADHQRIRQNTVLLPGGEELEYLTFPILEETGLVRHLFTTRLGGVSGQEFATMNFSVDRGDSEGNVASNYERIAGVLGCSVSDMVASHQTHTTNIRKVTSADRGKGIVCPRDYENVDGLMTNERGLVLVTYYADCVPLFFVDVRNRAVGLAHSGWRGTAAGMGQCMVDAMRESYGTLPEDLRVAIGPSICRDCYEVGEDVASEFDRGLGHNEALQHDAVMRGKEALQCDAVLRGKEALQCDAVMRGKEALQCDAVLRDKEVLRHGENTEQALSFGSVVTRGVQPGKYQLDLWLANRLVLERAGVCREHISLPDICTCHNSAYLFSHRASKGKRGTMGAFLGLA